MKNSRHGLLLLAVVIALLCASTSWGQEGELELVTDRPDQTESSVVVPPGFFQIEIGGTYTGSDTRVLETPGTLVRIGVFDRGIRYLSVQLEISQPESRSQNSHDGQSD